MHRKVLGIPRSGFQEGVTVMSSQPSTTIGVDIGDRYSYLCLLDTETGDVIE